MSFAVFVDGSANLPKELLDGIQVLPCTYTVDGKTETYDGNLEKFDAHTFYEGLRHGKVVQTSLLNTHVFLTHFEPVLAAGQDLIYVAMSSGISGTYGAAKVAAMELMEQYPDRFIHIVDSYGCGFGNGLLAVRAARFSREGMDVREAAKALDEEVPHTCQYFIVDDLNFLRRTGRISVLTAKIGSVLNIKPILYGDATGHIVASEKSRGRKKAIETIVAKYREKRMHTEDQLVCISHGDCPQDAEALARLVRIETPGVQVVISEHEPFSGAHVGPGMLALFFRGNER